MALSLNYKPVEVVDTSGLTEEEWLDYRRKGIGGSDVASIFGVSPWRTGRELYYDKIGVKPLRDDPSNWVPLEYGHRLESLVAKIFTFKTGLKTYPIPKMFRHPLFPFMQADVDFFVTLPDGSTGLLECKTTSVNNRDKWADGAIPYYYELQVRHYMAVMNIQVAYIAVLYGNNESSFVYQKITRDLAIEEDIIRREQDFWENFVLAKQEPPFVEDGDLVMDCLKRYLAGANNQAVPVKLEASYEDAFREYLRLADEKAELSRRVKNLESQQKKLFAPILEELGPACVGELTGAGGEKFEVTYKPSVTVSVKGNNVVRLQENYPEVYEKFATVTESRRLLVKRKEEEAA